MKFKRLFIAYFVGLSFMNCAYASAPVDIEVNGNYIKSDTMAFISDGYTMVPIRVLSNVFGCEDIVWNKR